MRMYIIQHCTQNFKMSSQTQWCHNFYNRAIITCSHMKTFMKMVKLKNMFLRVVIVGTGTQILQNSILNTNKYVIQPHYSVTQR